MKNHASLLASDAKIDGRKNADNHPTWFMAGESIEDEEFGGKVETEVSEEGIILYICNYPEKLFDG